MHEFSIGAGLVAAVLEELGRRKVPSGALRSVTVAVGALHQILPDTLTFAYATLARDTAAAGSELMLRPVPVTARCRACGWRGGLAVPVFLCGTCASGDLDLLTGRELHLESLEVNDDDDQDD